MASKRKSTPKTKIERLRTSRQAIPREAAAKKPNIAKLVPVSTVDERPRPTEPGRAEKLPAQTSSPKKSLFRRIYDRLLNKKPQKS